MNDRKPISLKKRFDIFKRDQFICAYCGRKPPTVILEVDHIISVADGGSNDEENLITSCFDCNRGKGASGLEGVPPVDLEARMEMMKERESQVLAYEDLLRQQRFYTDQRVEYITSIYESFYVEWTLTDNAKASIAKFTQLLPIDEIEEAMRLACGKMSRDKSFRYFCGICWRKVRENNQ